MKRTRQFTYASLVAACLVIVVTVWICRYGRHDMNNDAKPLVERVLPETLRSLPESAHREDPRMSSQLPKTAVSDSTRKSNGAAPPSSDGDLSTSIGLALEEFSSSELHTIYITVTDYTPMDPEKALDELEHAASQSESDFKLILEKMLEPRSASEVVVTLAGTSVEEQGITNSQGQLEFRGVPAGIYEITAEMTSRTSWSGAEQTARSEEKIRLYQDTRVNMEMRTDQVVLKGHIVDDEGNPVVGAKVSGIPYSSPETDEAVRADGHAVTGSDGTFELRGFSPPDIYRIAGYLNGGDPSSSDSPFYVNIRVEADGFTQTSSYKAPLVTEELLIPARRLLEAMSRMACGAKLGEKENITLPSSEGNVIKGVDIVLKKDMH